MEQTDVGEEDWKEDEAMESSEEDNAHVHAEIEHLKELRVGKRQNDDAAEFCQSDSAQHLHRNSHHTQLDSINQSIVNF